MKKNSSRDKFSWKNVFKGVGVIFGAIVFVSAVALVVYQIQSGYRDMQLDGMKVILKDTQRRLYEKQSVGMFGGKTPAETIYLYYEFLESRDFQVLSTYFVPERRTEELTRYDGVSEKEILAFVEELRSAELIAKKADLEQTTYIMIAPVGLGLKKMSNGVWEFEYINRKLK